MKLMATKLPVRTSEYTTRHAASAFMSRILSSKTAVGRFGQEAQCIGPRAREPTPQLPGIRLRTPTSSSLLEAGRVLRVQLYEGR
jgi:hypothetical protein